MRRRYSTPLTVAAAVLLTLGSLQVGWWLEDHYQRWIFLGSPVYSDVGRKPIDAFTFWDGDPQRNQRMMDIGMLPWWNDPRVKAAFWKPIAALTHMLDYRLWPTSPRLMHVHSIIWFALWVFSACLLYRGIMRATLAATLAGVLYAVAHAHAAPVAWLSNRNSMIAAVFGFLAIWAHAQWRRNRSRTWAVLSPLLLAMSLLSAEAGLGAAAYLVAYAVTLDPSGWRRGLARLWPHVLVIIGWRIVWSAQGYGAFAVDSMYIDPGGRPLVFAQLFLQRAPLYMLNQWTSIPAEIYHVFPARIGALLSGAGVAAVAILLLVFFPLLRRSRVARFWGIGMLLATVPQCAATPMSRHLVFIGLGGMGLLGQYFASALHRRFWRRPLVGRVAVGTFVVLLVCIHLVIAPVVLAARAGYFGSRGFMKSLDAVPFDLRSDRDLIFVNHPLPLHLFGFLSARAVDHEPLPRSAQILAPASTALLITRPDDRSLLVRPGPGSFATPMPRFANPEHPHVKDEAISLSSMKITITEMTADARPSAVLFEFNVPLEDASLQWIRWESGFHEFHPPAIGETVRLPRAG